MTETSAGSVGVVSGRPVTISSRGAGRGRRRPEGCGKVCGWKHPRASSAKLLWKERAIKAVLDFPRDTRVHMVTMRRPPEEEVGEGSDNEKYGPGSP